MGESRPSTSSCDLKNVQDHDLHLKRLHRGGSLGTVKRTGMSSERSSTGALGRLHLDGRFLEYERGKAGREG